MSEMEIVFESFTHWSLYTEKKINLVACPFLFVLSHIFAFNSESVFCYTLLVLMDFFSHFLILCRINLHFSTHRVNLGNCPTTSPFIQSLLSEKQCYICTTGTLCCYAGKGILLPQGAARRFYILHCTFQKTRLSRKATGFATINIQKHKSPAQYVKGPGYANECLKLPEAGLQDYREQR